MTYVPPPPRFIQAEGTIEQIRKQVLALARCGDHELRQAVARDIVDELCELEHLLEIHRSHLAHDPPE